MTGNFLIQCKTRKMEVLQFLAVAFGSSSLLKTINIAIDILNDILLCLWL